MLNIRENPLVLSLRRCKIWPKKDKDQFLNRAKVGYFDEIVTSEISRERFIFCCIVSYIVIKLSIVGITIVAGLHFKQFRSPKVLKIREQFTCFQPVMRQNLAKKRSKPNPLNEEKSCILVAFSGSPPWVLAVNYLLPVTQGDDRHYRFSWHGSVYVGQCLIVYSEALW